jgi:hypothetical protein
MGNKLEAVNGVLRRMGKLRVSSLDTGGTSTHAQVERMIDDAADRIMSQGWNWNRKLAVSVAPIATGQQSGDPRIGYIHVDKLELGAMQQISASGGGIEETNPCIINSTLPHEFFTGDKVYMYPDSASSPSPHDVEGYLYTITVIDANSFSLDGVDNTSPDSTYTIGGNFQKAYNIYHIDTDDSDINENLIRRGEYMYEVDDNTFAIGDTFKMTYTFQVEYEDIPPAFQDWVIADAALALNRNTSYAHTSPTFSRPRDSELQEEVRTRRSAAMQEEIRAADTNLLNTQEMRQIRGRPRTIDRSVY